MLPVDLKREHFSQYPPEARELATSHLAALQQLPLSFLPSLLREVIEYPNKFPVEQNAIRQELDSLAALTATQRREWFGGFSRLQLPATLQHFDWINQPGQFTEQLAADLWSSHQLDLFREAATAYGDRLRNAVRPAAPLMSRLGVAILGQGVSSSNMSLFRRLRPHGTYFSNVDPTHGLTYLLAAIADRAEKHPAPYAHWYVDGGATVEHSPLLTGVSYEGLGPLRHALLQSIDAQVAKPGMGPEDLRTYLAHLAPSDLGMHGDAVLDHFQLRLFTEGSGTQIFSTTFAQWTAREVLRRAQALTLLVRFAPRQRQRPMQELLSNNQAATEPDPEGSLVDADMGAYYHWINQQRLPGAERSSFVAWFEGHGQALAIGPALPRGAESNSRVDLRALLSLAAG